MAETIRIDVPRDGLGDELSEALAAHGLKAEVVGECLEVRFADEHQRLLDEAILAIEGYFADHELPFLVQRDGDGAVVRPPAD
jgi:hypothetical protein